MERETAEGPGCYTDRLKWNGVTTDVINLAFPAMSIQKPCLHLALTCLLGDPNTGGIYICGSIMCLQSVQLTSCVGPPLWSSQKYFDNYWMDC